MCPRPSAYSAVITLVGKCGTLDNDTRTQLIQRYLAGPSLLEEAWHAVPEPARRWRPATDSWSAHEIVVHCADSETSAATRIRLLVADLSPVIVGYDQDAWVDAFGYHDLPVDLALDVIRTTRMLTGIVIARLTEDQWSKTGQHSETGAYSGNTWLSIYGNHLHEHVEQINDNVCRWHDYVQANEERDSTA